MFHLIPSDVGRPLADLHSLSSDGCLSADAQALLNGEARPDREVETQDGLTYLRRILPYRSQSSGGEGVVITYTDITERKRAGLALHEAMRKSERANEAKSRFLAASHDLRQPLQTLTLLKGLLGKIIDADAANLTRGERAQQLMARFQETLAAMTSMLDTLLDINQIDAGVVQASVATVALGALLTRLHDEFAFHAEARGLSLRIVPCSCVVRTDPALLEQMLRNLLSNALKYTAAGKVLLGCRRAGAHRRIEVWDTGIGIAASEIDAVFEEYHQVDNAARERGHGLGLGLSIVSRLGTLLGHQVRLRSWPGRGSVFSIEVPIAPATPPGDPPLADPSTPGAEPRTGAILLVEDEPDVRLLLTEFLTGLGHHVVAAADGAAALALTAHGAIRPDLVLTDYNLPHTMNGRQLGERLRARFGPALPVIMLTGDISTGTLMDVAAGAFIHLNKPMQLPPLAALIARLLPQAPPPQGHCDGTVFVVDDDADVRAAVAAVLAQDGRPCATFESCEAFLAAHRPGAGQCLLLDARLPGMSGLDLLRRLHADGSGLPTIIVTGVGDVDLAVAAMQAGAADFIEKPVRTAALLAAIARALDQAHGSEGRRAWERQAAALLATLTPRQRQVMTMVLDGHPSKNIAADLGISQRTVENHRAAIMHKTASTSLPALARLVVAAAPLERAPGR
jgi:two-component system CheB/CheR fusion protein